MPGPAGVKAQKPRTLAFCTSAQLFVGAGASGYRGKTGAVQGRGGGDVVAGTMQVAVRRRGLLATGAALVAGVAGAQELRDRPAGQEVAPILFVHGAGDSAAMWMPTIWRFESNYYPRARLFAIDMRVPTARRVDAVRERGRSSVDEATAQLAQEVARVQRSTGIERMVLVAHGRGGNIVRNYLRGSGALRVKAAILCAAPSHGMIVSDTHMVGSEYNGASAFLRQLNAMPGEVSPGVPVTTLASDRMDKWAQPDGRFLGLPGVATGIGHDAPALRGATNIVLTGIDHMEAAYSADAFGEIYRIATGETPSVGRIRSEVKPTLNGRVSAYDGGVPTNIGVAGARLRVFAVDPATGQRIGRERHERITAADGSWGPMEIEPDVACEFELAVRGYPVTHIYRAPFPRGSEHVHLRPYLPEAADPKDGALVVVRRVRGFFDFGRDRIEIGGRKVDGAVDIPSENTLRVHTSGALMSMPVLYNEERAAGMAWPLAERHVTVIELGE